MRITYLTMDFDKAAWVRRMAAVCGIELVEADPRDLERLKVEQTPVVIDWDALEPMGQEREHLLNGASLNVLAVHGFKLPSWIGFVANRGVIVSKRADAAFFRTIAGARPAA